MKHNFLRFLTLTALIFGSLSLWAINWDSYGWVGNGSGNSAYTDAYKMDVPAGCGLVNIQSSFGTESGFYVTLPAADISCSLPSGKYAIQGTGMLFYVSAFTAQETEVTVTCNGGQNYVFTIYYKNGTTGGGSSEDEEPDEPSVGIDWSKISWVDASNNKFKVGADASLGEQMPNQVVNVQKPGWATENGIYMTFPGAVSSCTHNCAIDGGGICLYISQFTAKETKVTVTYAGGTRTFTIYYVDGTEPGPTSDLEDPNLTITDPSAAAIELAIDATKKITWTSSNTVTPTFTSSKESVATVSATGLITAKAIGSATITVKQDETDTYQEATQTITVTVAGDKSKNTECSGWDNDIWASEGGYTYAFSTSGTTVHIEFTAIGNFPGGFTNPQVYFPSLNKFEDMTQSGKVLSCDVTNQTIDNDLKIRGYFPREAGTDETQIYTYTVGDDCQPHAVDGVSITSKFTQLEVGQVMTMTAAVTPANATNKNVTWSITSGDCATINSSGTLTGNAEGSVTVQVTTDDGGFTATKTISVIPAKPSAPSALPDAPTHPANKVKAVYSETYGADCDFGEWGTGTSYTQETYGKKYTTNSNGYFGICFEGAKALNCSSMEYLHADVWVKDDKSIRFVPVHTGCDDQKGVVKNLTGGQWNSIDIPISDFKNGDDWSNVYQIKIDQAPYLILWFNNVYFYTTATETKYSVSAIAGDGGSATASASSVTSGTEVTFTATPDCGYTFSSWTKGGEVVTGAEATYTTAITEETTLTANFTTTFAPVTPTHDAANVMTVYGDYGKQTGLNVSPWWDPQTTQYNETTIGDKKMARYTNINFQGWDFNDNRMNVSDMQYVHLDLYASVESNIMFSLIWAGGEQAVTKHLNGCTMESLDIPLSEFTNAGLTTIRQLKFDAQGLSLAGKTLIVQNIYFYKLPPAPVESVTITNAPSEMAVNSDLTLSATIAPVNAANKNVTWSITAGSDNATIDHSTGVLHAKSAGQVTVQVTTEDGEKTDSKTITIKAAGDPVFPFTDDPTGDQLTQLANWLSHYYGQKVDFTLPRSLSSSYFNTICLPFGLNSFAGTPFEGATVAELVDATVEGIDHSLALTLVFQPVTSMAAGVPYIIQPASDLTNPRFDDVTISATEAGNTVVGNANFVGCFAPKDVTNSFQNVFLAANNTLKWNEKPATIKGYRGYFAITGVAATSPMRANAPRLVIRNTPTEMQNAESTLRSEKVIRNGQLVIIRNGVEYNAQGQVIQ